MNDILIKFNQIGKIFDCLSLGTLILSDERKIIHINKSAELMTGYKEDQIAGKYCYHVFLDYLCGGRCKYLESRSDNKEVVADIVIKDLIDETHSITKIEAPLFDASHTMIGCMEVFQDHSAFKELIKRIRFEDMRLKIIFDNLDIGVMTIDRGSYISFFNAKAESVTGFSRSEVLGKSCRDIFGKKFYADIIALQESVDNKDHPGVESQITTKEGRFVPVHTKYIQLKNEDGRIVGGLMTLSDLSLKYYLNSAIKDRYTFYDMVGKNPAIRKLFEIIPVVAASDVTVLIEGPTGTGKDVLARIIHNSSHRAEKPLVKVNCAALPDNLLESEMFGYVKGAFTGAGKDKPGRFHEANGGTIFLDEIGDLPLSLQAKLLRVLEDKEFYPLGSRKTSKVDVRIISASNQNLERLVGEKRFREDLFYRLNVMRLELQSLGERKNDIPLLVSHILNRLSSVRDITPKKISEDAMEILLSYPFPGNIRELENILEHAMVICQGTIIEKKHFPVSLLKKVEKRVNNPEISTDNDVSEIPEKTAILTVLKKNNWNRGKAAKALGMDRSTLWRKMKNYGIRT